MHAVLLNGTQQTAGTEAEQLNGRADKSILSPFEGEILLYLLKQKKRGAEPVPSGQLCEEFTRGLKPLRGPHRERIQELLKQGAIEEIWTPSIDRPGAENINYQLTETGRNKALSISNGL